MTKTSIWVTFQREGVHRYPAAATDPKLESVSFLGHPHRHIFHFRVEMEVFHDDRDVEFIMLKRELEGLYNTGGSLQLNNMSCEMLARELLIYLTHNYPSRDLTIEVSEDNENGCKLIHNYEDYTMKGDSK